MGRRMLVALLFALVAVPSASAAPPAPFGHACTAQNGVRFCPTPNDAERVPAFDGTPLDIDVTLPPQGDGPFPTIVMLHGYGGDKDDFEQRSPEGDSAENDVNHHYNNTYFARRGYAVVNASARGFGRSCGRPDSRTPLGQPSNPPASCARGWLHIADQRFEVRDVQDYLGKLVDQGISDPRALGSTGISYGGGQSMQLAYLRDRVRRPDGSFAPWRSPAGTPLELSAAYPKWPWSDLVYSLLPNGRYLDTAVSGQTQSRRPIGVPIQSFINGLFATGAATGFYAPPGVDPTADIVGGFAQVLRGEPVEDDARATLNQFYEFKSAYALSGRTPPPLLLQSGWTDDLFPVSESLRVYDQLRARDPRAPVSLQFGDLGHMRGSQKDETDRNFNDEGSAFFDRELRDLGDASPGEVRAPAPGAVNLFTQTCPKDAPPEGPIRAASWQASHPGAFRLSGRAPQTVRSDGGNPLIDGQFDPIASGNDPCRTTPATDAPGTAVYRRRTGDGFLLLGRPIVRARVSAQGPFAQLDSRLWDVAPGGRQTLISRGAYRLGEDAGSAARVAQAGGRTITFQLSGNGYRVAPGHTLRLELIGREAPRLRPSNGRFSVRVSDLSAELPTRQRPGGELVASRLAPVRSSSLRLTARPPRAPAGRRTRFVFSATASGRPVAGAVVRFAGRSVRTDARGRAAVVRRLGAGLYTARVTDPRPGAARTGRARVRIVRIRLTG